MGDEQTALTAESSYSIVVHMKRRADTRQGMIVTTIALAPELHRRLAIAAVEDRAAITELVRAALAEWLDRRERKQNARGRKR